MTPSVREAAWQIWGTEFPHTPVHVPKHEVAPSATSFLLVWPSVHTWETRCGDVGHVWCLKGMSGSSHKLDLM